MASAHVPLTLQWQDINLRVILGKGDQATEKSILTEVSAFAEPGELLAIMGPSGAGKTSLLNCLAMRNPDFQGTLTINGSAWTSEFARSTAYMHQSEHFLNELTPREHLQFQAELRMPASTAAPVREAAVDRVIAELGLEKCQHTPIGDPLAGGGLSRNERKRLNFASEVLTNPTLLFVDEPTTGLDSFMAENVVKQLKALASGGKSGTERTIICTIHQPSSDVFKVFDKLLLLADGRVAYFGPVSSVGDYFAALQHPAPPHTNPADHIMRVLVDPTKPELAHATRKAICDHAMALPQQQPNKLEAQVSSKALTSQHIGVDGVADQAPSWCAQFTTLARREIKSKLRSKVAFHANLARTVVLSTIFGLTFFRTELTQKMIFPLNGVIFFITAMSIIQGALAQVMTLPAKMPAILREQRSGAFSISAFYLAKTSSDLPFDVFFTFVWSAITYWMINLGDDFTNFLVFFALQILCAQVACGIGYLAGFLFDNPAVAFLFCILNTIPAMLFGGFMININSVPAGFRWLRDVSSIKYGYSLVMINFYDGPAGGDLPCTAEDIFDLGFCPYPTGQDVLIYSGMDVSMWWRDLVALIAIAAFYRVMALWAITKRARPRAFEGAAPDDGTAVIDAASDPTGSDDNNRDSRRNRVPITLQWHSLTLNVTDTDGSEKTILSNATGIAKPGRVLVVMGPSGAGKTSYLNSLAGKQSATGELKLNGQAFRPEYTRFGGFMFQEEMFQEGLSVREHLRFQAALRMPASVSASERLARVETAIVDLGLSTCADTLIGVIGGGISGGERKRLSFASEVLMDPSILFVDEPTSGLDSAMAENVMQYLQKLAVGSRERDEVPRTVIATIHQPSRALYDLFDDLCLLHDGRTAYFGKAGDAPLQHFTSQGFECPVDCNPPDHFMRLLGTEGGTADEDIKAANRARAVQLCNVWAEKRVFHNVEEGLPSIAGVAQDEEYPTLVIDSNYDTSFYVQFTSLLRREITTRKRSKLMFKAVVGRTIFMTLLVGLIWFQNLGAGNDQEGVQSIFGCLQMIAINAYMTSGFGLTQELPAQLAPTLREHRAGMYSIGSWFASRTLSDIPFETIFPVISATGFWLLVGFRDDFASFLNFALLMIATSWNANAFGIFAGALGGTPDSAFGIFGAFVFPCIIFSGFLITGDAIPIFFRWIEWISPFKYIFTLMNINQWNDYGALGECFCADGSVPTACSGEDCVPHTARVCSADANGTATTPRCAFPDGEAVLSYFSISTSDATLWIVLLIVNTLAWRALAYVALRWRARSTITVKKAAAQDSNP